MSLYEEIGGEAAVNTAVQVFYGKVLRDTRVSAFFDGVDMEHQVAMQKAFLTMAFGGPNHYNGRALREAHAPLVTRGLTDAHFDAVIENLAATLKELDVADELIAQVAAIAEGVRKDVLGRR